MYFFSYILFTLLAFLFLLFYTSFFCYVTFFVCRAIFFCHTTFSFFYHTYGVLPEVSKILILVIFKPKRSISQKMIATHLCYAKRRIQFFRNDNNTNSRNDGNIVIIEVLKKQKLATFKVIKKKKNQIKKIFINLTKTTKQQFI